MTEPERIALLLPWINGELFPSEGQAALRKFLRSFVGSYLRTDDPVRQLERASSREIDNVRIGLTSLLRSAFAVDWGSPHPSDHGQRDIRGKENLEWDDLADDLPLPITFPSLRYGVREVAPAHRPKLSGLTRAARASYAARGYELRVEAGRLPDLVAFLFMVTLTSPGIMIGRCSAPVFRDWSKQCGRFHVWVGRGTPRKFCSDDCADRASDKRKEDRRIAPRRAARVRKLLQEIQSNKKSRRKK